VPAEGLETIERWRKAEGVNLEPYAQRARQKLENAGRVFLYLFTLSRLHHSRKAGEFVD
jgi:hypothetical protein